MQRYLAGSFELVEERERGQRDLPVTPAIARLTHREVVRERDPRHPRRLYPILHRERDRRYPPLLNSFAYQPDGPVAQWSGGREQHRVYLVVCQLPSDLGRALAPEWTGVVDGPHEAEVAAVEFSDHSLACQLSHRPQREDRVEVRSLVGPVVGVGPGE